MGKKANFEANSTAIGEKVNAFARPSPADRRPQGVLQRFPNWVTHHLFVAVLQQKVKYFRSMSD